MNGMRCRGSARIIGIGLTPF
ncbi:hypothetical protein [Rosenbergiella epipactidis]